MTRQRLRAHDPGPGVDPQEQVDSPECRRHREGVLGWPGRGPDEQVDERLSADLLPKLWSLYGDSDEQVRARLVAFRKANRRQLDFVEHQHADDPRVAPLLHQPELPLILDRLEADPTGLLLIWPTTVPRIWLEALAEAWGQPF